MTISDVQVKECGPWIEVGEKMDLRDFSQVNLMGLDGRLNMGMSMKK